MVNICLKSYSLLVEYQDKQRKKKVNKKIIVSKNLKVLKDFNLISIKVKGQSYSASLRVIIE